jgi:hypothetical protein
MRRTRLPWLAPFLLCAGGLITTRAAPVDAAVVSASACSGGAIIHEALQAPSTVALNQPFQVKLVVRNCTGASQDVTLEGQQHAPGSCSVPVIDPLSVNLQPYERFVLHQDVPGLACSGTYTVTWSVIQNDHVLATRTRHVTMTNG